MLLRKWLAKTKGMTSIEFDLYVDFSPSDLMKKSKTGTKSNEENKFVNTTMVVTNNPEQTNCGNNCSSRGICDERSGKCVCESLYFGNECQSKSDSSLLFLIESQVKLGVVRRYLLYFVPMY